MTGFSEQLRHAAQPVWDAIFRHPFLAEIKDGTLPLATFQYYLGQDYHYLEGFGRAVAMALAKAPDAALLQELAHRVMTPVERPLHHRLIEAAGLTMADVESTPRSPTNTAYVNHMLATAARHGLGPTAAALLPCPWTYHLLKDEVGQSGHPLYGQWTRFYVEGFLQSSVEAWKGFVDEMATRVGEQERAEMRHAFMVSSWYEYMFWDAAYRREQWTI